MKALLVLAFVCIVTVNAASRAKRAAYELPDGAEILIGSVKTSFACPQGAFGYFADVDNNCNIFHICHPVTDEDGVTETQQFTFLCGNQTVFNQLSFTCAYPEEAVPCGQAPDFFYLNDNVRLGDPKVPFLNDQDIQRAAPLIVGLAARYSGQAVPQPAPGGGRGRGR